MADENSYLLIMPDSGRSLRGLAASAIMFGCSLLLAFEEVTPFRLTAAIFFGMCTVACLPPLTRHVELELSRERFALRTGFVEITHSWQEIERFGIFELGPVKIVSVELIQRPTRVSPMRLLSRAVSGFDYAIPNVFGLPPKDLLEELQRWHTRGLAGQN
jgi:hypothetical protein